MPGPDQRLTKNPEKMLFFLLLFSPPGFPLLPRWLDGGTGWQKDDAEAAGRRETGQCLRVLWLIVQLLSSSFETKLETAAVTNAIWITMVSLGDRRLLSQGRSRCTNDGASDWTPEAREPALALLPSQRMSSFCLHSLVLSHFTTTRCRPSRFKQSGVLRCFIIPPPLATFFYIIQRGPHRSASPRAASRCFLG